MHRFDHADDTDPVVIDPARAQIWDASTVAALDAIAHRYATRGTPVSIVGLQGPSAQRYDRHTGQLTGSPRHAVPLARVTAIREGTARDDGSV